MAFKKKSIKEEKKIEKKIENIEKVEAKGGKELEGSAALAAKINSIIRGK